jgi:hypothetical protein
MDEDIDPTMREDLEAGQSKSGSESDDKDDKARELRAGEVHQV